MAVNVFFDLDGTLAEWKEISLKLTEEEQTDPKVVQAKLRQILLAPGYFRNLAPYQNVVAFANLLAKKEEIHEFILGCSMNEATTKEKQEWAECLPDIPIWDQIYIPDGNGERKFLYVENRIHPDDINILIDDHTPNLIAWEKMSSNNIAIKLMNPVNGIHGRWTGNVLFYNDEPEELLRNFYFSCGFYQEEDFEKSPEYERNY